MKIDEFQHSSPSDLFLRGLEGDQSVHEAGLIPFQTSIQSFDLASSASVAFSPEDLIETGTWEKYERRVAALGRAHPRGDPFAGFLSRLAVDGWSTRNARQADRSALVRIAARIVLDLMPIYWRQVLSKMEAWTEREALLDDLRPKLSASVRQQMKDARRPLTAEEGDELKAAAWFLIQVPPDPFHSKARERESKHGPSGNRRRQDRSAQTPLTALNRHARRKRTDVPDYDWRSHFWTTAVLRDPHLDPTRRAILATMIATGARPAEFSDDLGVNVRLVSEGGRDRLLFEIHGAKTTDQVHEGLPGKGQSIRTLELECKTPETRWLRDRLADQRFLRLELSSPVHATTGIPLHRSERHRRVSVSLGKLVTRLGKIAFPRLRHNLTPYVFRHALGADMKASDRFEPEAIAKALGHQSARTQSSYGLTSGARNLSLKRVESIVRISAASLVRSREQHGPRPDYLSELCHYGKQRGFGRKAGIRY
ncbi:site-specific integrase [Roseovarius aquimarinus]|uniref:Phage integrase family protein n=1 Tax=Roseovarius aquimarinus TaxID=1229156 RepID=A0ABW7I2S1_9RHOB